MYTYHLGLPYLLYDFEISRVEFVYVELAAPVAGECGNDTLTITGDPITTPTLCGTLTDDPTSRFYSIVIKQLHLDHSCY